MPDPNLVRLNQVPYSWNSCAHFFAGFPYKGITAVEFGETREVSLVHAAQQDGTPLGITAGIYKVDNLMWTLLTDSAAGLFTDLTVLGLGSYGDASFNYMCQIFEPTLPPSIPITTVISGCRITGVSDRYDVKADAIVTEIKASAMLIVRAWGPVPLTLFSGIRKLLP